jgi:ribosomal protein L37AE/L43A
MTGTWKCIDCGAPVRQRTYSPPKAGIKGGGEDDAEVRRLVERAYRREAGKPLCRACWLTRLRLDGRYRKAARAEGVGV